MPLYENSINIGKNIFTEIIKLNSLELKYQQEYVKVEAYCINDLIYLKTNIKDC
jgi:hypothetical protein